MFSCGVPGETRTPEFVVSLNRERWTKTFFDAPFMVRALTPPVIWIPSRIRPSTPATTLPVPKTHAPGCAQRIVRTPPEWPTRLSFAYLPTCRTRILQPVPPVADAKLDGVTFCAEPHSLMGAAAAA